MSLRGSTPGTGIAARKRNTKKIAITKRIRFLIDFSVTTVFSFLKKLDMVYW